MERLKPVDLQQQIQVLETPFDITNALQGEDACKESREAVLLVARAFSTLMRNLPGIAYRRRNDQKWTIEDVSEGCYQLTEYHPIELIGNQRISWEQLIHPDDRSSVWNDVQAALEDNSQYQLIYRITTASGLEKWVWEQGCGVSGSGELLDLEGFIIDITERKQAEEALRQAEAKYRSIFENAIEGIFQTTSQGCYISANPALARIYGYESPAQLMARLTDIEHQLYLDPNRRAYFVRLLQENDAVSGFESAVYRKDGSVIWISENARAVRDREGRLLYYEGTVEDVTERKRVKEQLRERAFYDALTGLPNRALFRERLSQAVEQAKQFKDYCFAVLFLDLDRFKLVNDSLGHLVGDKLLVALARRLETCIRTQDTVARLGGDEFTILLEGIEDVSHATSVAQRINAELTSPFHLDGHTVFTAASIGIALNRRDEAEVRDWGQGTRDWGLGTGDKELGTRDKGLGKSPSNPQSPIPNPQSPIPNSQSPIPNPQSPISSTEDDLLRDADKALYRAKALGKGRYEVFDKTVHQSTLPMLQLETDLRRAIENQEFQIQYQPIVSLSSGKITGFEALLMLWHPLKGFVPTAEFMPIAQETELMIPIGWWMLRQACRQLISWQQQCHEQKLTLHVNLFKKQFLQPDLLSQIDQALQDMNLDGSSLHLEIPESCLLENGESAPQILAQLKKRNIIVCIDDFGKGYSCLSQLHQFTVDALKFDRSLLATDKRTRENPFREKSNWNTEYRLPIVQAIVMLAHNLGMSAIAQGIETAQELAELQQMKCEYGQGNYFFEPMDAESVGALINSCQLIANF
ncbi:bifunctional diguanylate cyclase/phosphodiesterase [Trichocoleus sp. FACHB-90]|uniref:EAL domain-containing protein n=1 Tax=Trichocoleus sp. FACHB-90 TaxID=2692876 RepID=UPI0018F04DEF